MTSAGMYHHPHYTEPSVPEGWEPFENCSIEISGLPLEAFELQNDGRKRKLNCRNRRTVLASFARWANPDGTSCYPSQQKVEQLSGFSHGTFVRLRADLEDLGFVVNGGYAWEEGPRARRLVRPVSGSQDTNKNLSRKSGYKEESQDSKSRKSVATDHNPPFYSITRRHPARKINGAPIDEQTAAHM